MIKFEVNESIKELSDIQTPVLNIGKIVLSTSDKEWVTRLDRASLTITFSHMGGKNETIVKPLSLGSYITPNTRQPILDINHQFSVVEELKLITEDDLSNWRLSIKLNDLQLKEGENLNIFTISIVDSSEILKKLTSYLFEKIDFFSSYESVSIIINDSLVLTRITFSDKHISQKTSYESTFTYDKYAVKVITIKDQLRNLLPYTIKGNLYNINLEQFNLLIESFSNNVQLYKEEEFGSKGDGLLYYLNRDLNRNASILAYKTGDKFNETFPEKILEKIDATFNINLKYIDLNSPILCFIFKKSLLSLSSSQIFEDNGKECLRIFIDRNEYLNNIDGLSKSIQFHIELFDKLKECFYRKEVYLSELIKNNKFIPPYFEVIPNVAKEIFSSSIRIYMNKQLHDKLENSYIRNIKLNIELKKG
jgi:hypothetical protein